MNMRLNDTPKLAIDLSKTAARFVHGDLTVYLTWTHHDRSPALVIVPSLHQINPERTTPCIVPLGLAYMWDEHTGDGAHCATTSIHFAASLGMDPMNPRNLFRITDLVRNHLQDLLTCPPMPAVDQVEVAFATMVNRDTGKITQTGITEDV